MKTIDADALLEKLNLLSEKFRIRAENEDRGFLAVQCGVSFAEDAVNAAPTLDAIPVVRCKDCALGDTDGKHIPGKVYCDRMDCMHGEDFFCADGRKKTKWGACDGA